jgi:N utilization substance protein B
LTEQDDSDRIQFTGRRLARVIALEAIYRNELLNEALEDALKDIVERTKVVEEDVKSFAGQLIESYATNREEVDRLLAETAEHWAMDRINEIDKAILRLSTAEMMGVPDIPYRVSISEAIELAKDFSTEDSGRFVNGVLDGVAAKLNLKEAD